MVRDVLFIWIPRTAGTSIFNALSRHGMVQIKWPETLGAFTGRGMVTFTHMSVMALLELGFIEEEFFRRAFKFCFVRNPWDRLVSLFFKIKEDDGIQGGLDRYSSFEQFCKDLPNLHIDPPGFYHYRGYSFFSNQVDWITDGSGRIFVDFVGRFENLREDFEKVCSIIGVEAELPHDNRSSHRPYWEYYTEETRRIVEAVYRRDIETFGYSFR